MDSNELYHYGVPGMKWGVRRDVRILANHRRNSELKLQKNKYRYGEITKEQYSNAKRKANAGKKKYMSDIENKFRNAKSERERDSLSNDITNTAVKEVPNIKLKRGIAAVNQFMGAASIGSAAYTSAVMTMINPAFGAAYIGAGAVTAAAEVGYRYVTRSIIDKTS